MQLQIESTTKIVTVNGVPARIWEGTTANGTEVHCYITRVAVKADSTPEQFAEFERDLQDCRPPSVDVQAIPLSLIL